MCGIFGIITTPKANIPAQNISQVLEKLALLSQSRGRDSAGVAFRNSEINQIQVVKGDVPIGQLIQSKVYKEFLSSNLQSAHNGNGFAAFGHARLVTNGSQLQEQNNQPVIKDNMVVVHNGIIVNGDTLWEANPLLTRQYSIDTEIIPALINQNLENGLCIQNSITSSLKNIQGTYSLAMLFQNHSCFALATNNGSLYYQTDSKNYIVFASEKHFLNKLNDFAPFKKISSKSEILQLLPAHGYLIELNTIAQHQFSLNDSSNGHSLEFKAKPFSLSKIALERKGAKREIVIDPSVYINRATETNLFNLLEYNNEAISHLKRCSKCLLPETFPFIEFDSAGVCNYCHNHKPSSASSSYSDLERLVAPYRKPKGQPDCIVPFSGGRDSTYSLHIVKKELGLNPIAFTYDWGMVTDLARRNIARVCGKLGVENIIVSADIHWKRENIRKNIEAWLKHPDLGMIPLFMAGDKYFFYYCNQVKKQTGIDLNIWGINNLENTNFKTGFAGLKPGFNKKTIYSLSLLNQLILFGFVAGNLLKSPGYINGSMLDSLGSFAARYISPKKDYYHLFDYYQWNEEEVNSLVKNDYDWELAIDTSTTWRIGDGTASFYNYIYYTVAGFSENDTFRSNQIREGMIDRATALKLCEEENRPRYETLRWYFEILGLDFAKTIKSVNSIPKLYNY